jgi:hypothetical protein
MTETADEIITTDAIIAAAERRAAYGFDPQAIAENIIEELKERRDASGETSLNRSVLDKLDARIGEMAVLATERDHPKLRKGAELLRKAGEVVQQMLDLADEDAQEHLNGLAEKIRVCIKKSDNFAVTAGQHLRAAREQCRAIGLDFNKWCAEANLGIKRARIYQLMGPDPITTERRGTNHSEEPENVQSVDVPQITHVEQPAAEEPAQPVEQPLAITVQRTDTPAAAPALRDLPFDAALAQFTDWFAELTITQTAAVQEVIDRVDRMRDAAQAQPVTAIAA